MRPLEALEGSLSAAPGGRWIERIVGAAAALTGLALAATALTAAFRGMAVEAAVLPLLLVFAAVVGLLAAFFLSVGWRLLRVRPNRHGGLLSPVFCLLAGAFFVLAGLAMGVSAFRLGHLAELEGAMGTLVLGVLAAWFGWWRRRPARAA